MSLTITACLVPFPDGSGVVAVGFLEGLGPTTVLLLAVNETPWSALPGMFVQAKFISDAAAPPKYLPLTTIARN